MLNFKNSLALRITLPVAAVAIILSVALFLFIVNTVSEFATNEIRQNLNSLSTRIVNVCNINFENLLMSGQAADPAELIIRQGMTMGQIEDLFNQEFVKGYIYDTNRKELLLKTDLPKPPGQVMDKIKNKDTVVSLDIGSNAFVAYQFDFQPWDWQITIIKNKKEYVTLIEKVKKVQLYTMGLLFLGSGCLIFFIYRIIMHPINTIIEPLQKGEKPDYQGTDAFEFLSGTIAGMMDSIRENEEKYR
ncbi:MAG: hypothetical protein GY729_11390, partial [Desulfobacteraceae bacterium]|nr:hypothetical protein [Desulfobacteraceae bacterium]